MRRSFTKVPLFPIFAADSPSPIFFSVTEKIIVDVPALTRDYGYEGIGYVFNLYAQDDRGTYLVSCNRWSGAGTVSFDGIKTNNSLLHLTALVEAKFMYRDL